MEPPSLLSFTRQGWVHRWAAGPNRCPAPSDKESGALPLTAGPNRTSLASDSSVTAAPYAPIKDALRFLKEGANAPRCSWGILSIILFNAGGAGGLPPLMGGPASVRPTGRTWGEHEGSRGGRNARARSEGFRVGGRLPLPRGALPYQRSDLCASVDRGKAAL